MGALRLTQKVPDFAGSPIFWRVEQEEDVTVGATWPPPCVYVWSDKRQEQSKTDEP